MQSEQGALNGSWRLVLTACSHAVLLSFPDSPADTPQHKRLLKFYAAGDATRSMTPCNTGQLQLCHTSILHSEQSLHVAHWRLFHGLGLLVLRLHAAGQPVLPRASV
jgi:hypothetical protein